MFNIYAHLMITQVTDMTVARCHFVICSKELLDGLCLGRRLNDNKISCHYVYLFK